jgi:hypothetical protein
VMVSIFNRHPNSGLDSSVLSSGSSTFFVSND